MVHVKVAKRTNTSPYTGRWRSADGKWHQTSGHSSAADAMAAAEQQASCEKERVDAFPEHDYFVGRYLTPGGRWLETEDGFDTAGDALAEARELEQAARAAASPAA